MDFERGLDPKRSLNIGEISKSLYIESLIKIVGFDHESDYIIKRTHEFIEDPKEVIDILQMIEDGKLSSDLFKVVIKEQEMIEDLSQYKGKYLKYIFYPRIMAQIWSDVIKPQEFTFKIPK